MRRSLPAALVLLITLAGCSGDAGTEVTSRPGTAPSLLTPEPGVPITQNDATTGCPFSDTHGYGFAVRFSWSPVPGAGTYHLRLHHLGSQFPAIDMVVGVTELTVLECNAYVIDANLYDWHWTVAAVSDEGEEGPWAQEGIYEFAPMAFPPQP
jgi:hypothetical protein